MSPATSLRNAMFSERGGERGVGHRPGGAAYRRGMLSARSGGSAGRHYLAAHGREAARRAGRRLHRLVQHDGAAAHDPRSVVLRPESSRRSTSRPTSRSSCPRSGRRPGPWRHSGPERWPSSSTPGTTRCTGEAAAARAAAMTSSTTTTTRSTRPKRTRRRRATSRPSKAPGPSRSLKNGSFILTGYRPGTNVACGADAHTLGGSYLMQRSALNCALAGQTGEEILQIYYGPGLVIQGAPGSPGAPTGVTAVGSDSSARSPGPPRPPMAARRSAATP